jgi:hypothetical protein
VGLPAAEVDLATEMPDDSQIASHDQHAVRVLLDAQIGLGPNLEVLEQLSCFDEELRLLLLAREERNREDLRDLYENVLGLEQSV